MKTMSIFKKRSSLIALLIGVVMFIVLQKVFTTGIPFAKDTQTILNPIEFMTRKNWTVSTENSVFAAPPSYNKVQDFINLLSNEDLDDAKLGEYKFMDLNDDGFYELIASIDYSGRGFYNTVVVIEKENENFRMQGIPAWNAKNISRVIVDLDDNGTKELVVPKLLSDYEGAKCAALWTSVYVWDGQVYVDASSSFPEIYEDRIRILEEKVQQTSVIENIPDELKRQTLSCYYMELDKANRFLGLDLRAGFERAVEWMQSSDVSLKRKAVRVFADIGDKDSLQNLRILSQDSDPSVAEKANTVLRSR